MERERKYWNPEAETMSSSMRQEAQLSELQAQMRYAYTNSSLHRRVWDEAGLCARIAAQSEKDLQIRTEVELVPLDQLATLGPPHKIPRVVDLTK